MNWYGFFRGFGQRRRALRRPRDHRALSPPTLAHCGASAISGWTITKLAALQDAGNTRKFFYDPDIVQTNVFTALMLGSGNREQPLFCRTPTSIELAGGGLPPSPVTGTVEVQVPPIAGDPNQTTTTKKVPFIIGGINPALSSLAVSKVPINVDPTRRIYWYSSNVH